MKWHSPRCQKRPTPPLPGEDSDKRHSSDEEEGSAKKDSSDEGEGSAKKDEEEEEDPERLLRKERRHHERRARKRVAPSSRSGGGQITCGICNKVQVHAKRLREHMSKVHSGAKYPCKRCPRVCSSKYNQRRYNYICRRAHSRANPDKLQEGPQSEAEDTGKKQEAAGPLATT